MRSKFKQVRYPVHQESHGWNCSNLPYLISLEHPLVRIWPSRQCARGQTTFKLTHKAQIEAAPCKQHKPKPKRTFLWPNSPLIYKVMATRLGVARQVGITPCPRTRNKRAHPTTKLWPRHRRFSLPMLSDDLQGAGDKVGGVARQLGTTPDDEREITSNLTTKRGPVTGLSLPLQPSRVIMAASGCNLPPSSLPIPPRSGEEATLTT